jgi:predicted transposase YdaD
MSALEQARVEGIEEGIEKEGNNKARKIARNLLMLGNPTELVSTVTELSIEEIEELRKETNS